MNADQKEYYLILYSSLMGVHLRAPAANDCSFVSVCGQLLFHHDDNLHPPALVFAGLGGGRAHGSRGDLAGAQAVAGVVCRVEVGAVRTRRNRLQDIIQRRPVTSTQSRVDNGQSARRVVDSKDLAFGLYLIRAPWPSSRLIRGCQRSRRPRE